jgi:hypothetical protein
MHEANWQKFLNIMRSVAQRHDMELHGGIEKDPDGKPLFNAYIARGYSFWFGDDLDLWKQSDTHIARETVIAAAPLRCENERATQTPR